MRASATVRFFGFRFFLQGAVLATAALLQACSGGSDAPEATVSIAGTDSVYAQKLATTKNVPLTITLRAKEGESGLSFSVSTLPQNGSLTGELSGFQPVMVYTPALDFAGTDSFDFEVSDADGSSTATITITVYDNILPDADTDGDGLADLDELNKYRTNPELADTDGDGFSDFQEVIDLGFNATVNNYRFNPLIADTPEIDVRMVSVPDIRINYTLTDGTSRTVGTSRSQTSSQSVSTSVTESESTTVSESQTASTEISSTVSVSVEAELFSPPKATTEASVTATAGYSYERTTTNEQSTSWTEEQTTENSETFEQSESFEQNNSVSASEGEISIAVDIVNKGHISYTLQNLFLSATYVRPRGSDPLVPVGNLAFDGGGGSFPEVTLSPGQSTGTLVFRGTGVNLEKIKDILADSRGFSVRPTLYTLLDQDNVAYNFASTAVISNGAMVMVDYNGNGSRDNLIKMVAVNGVPGEQISMDDALNRVLKLNAQTTTDSNDNTYIDSVDGLGNAAPDAFWLIIHARQSGNNKVETTVYTTPADKQRWETRNPNVKNLVASYDPAAIRLGAGDVLHLVYMQDSDQDGLSNRMEFFYKSDPNNPDTDGDGLTDGVETKDGWTVAYEDIAGANVLRKVYSSPIRPDSDFDGRNDDFEANLGASDDALRFDPMRFDTDGDGLDDLIDDYDAGAGTRLANEYDDLRIRNISAAANLVGSGPYDVDVSFDMPPIIANANINGITEYIVVTLRYVDSSGQGDFPPPATLQDGFLYLVGDKVACDNGQNGCEWEVVDVHTPTLNAAPGNNVFTDAGLLNPEVPGVSPADVAKYVFYVGVNGRYTRQNVEKLVSNQTEALEIHMIGGSFNNVRTVFSTTTTSPNIQAAMTSQFSWLNNGKPVYFDFLYDKGNGNGAYDAWDGSSGEIGAPLGDYALPYSLMRPGDGKLDIRWYLYANGNRLNDPAIYPISNSFDPYWVSGAKNLPLDIYKGGVDVSNLFTEGYATTAPALDSDGNAVFTLVVPAVPGRHLVELIIEEYDYARSEYNQFVSPPDLLFPNRPQHGLDAVWLRRDEQGVWTAEPADINTNQINKGTFRDGANVTRQGNINPIKYLTRTIRLSDEANPGSTSMQMDFEAEFHIYVR